MEIRKSINGKISFLITAAGIMAFSFYLPQATLTKKWESEAVYKTPESVIYDEATKLIYVANINGSGSEKDRNGFISKVNVDGKLEQLEWITGLDGPKGMGIFKGKLYISDITKVVVADIKSGKVEKSFEAEGSKFLNDITIDSKGNVYVSDSDVKKIYLLKDDKIRVWLENSEIKKPNGLLAEASGLRVIDMDGGTFYTIAYADKKLKAGAKNIPSGDGVVNVGPGEYIISNWNGEINHVKGNTVHKLLDTKEQKINAADIWYIKEHNLIVVPTFFDNRVVAYTLNK